MISDIVDEGSEERGLGGRFYPILIQEFDLLTAPWTSCFSTADALTREIWRC